MSLLHSFNQRMFVCPSFDYDLWLDLLNMNVTPGVIWGWTYTGCGIICCYSWHERVAQDEPFLERNARSVHMPICHPDLYLCESSLEEQNQQNGYAWDFLDWNIWYGPGGPMVVSYWSGQETGSCSVCEAEFISEAPSWRLEGSWRVTGLQFILEAWRPWFSHPRRNPAVKR